MVKNILRRVSRPLNFDKGDDLAALDEAATGSPRATAIVATALVEEALRWSLCGFLIPDINEADLFDNEVAPLKSLAEDELSDFRAL